ncbi:carbohydrate sulfotransferase 11-like [Leptopilina heterotoma]|uniref:carbohydrate sulfotransferase 11-like n=1 Tax=Leptopilina heterotoma TaxID=63436 RepID=UPI001CA92145|nr:carbohydrate sulfotransferase 11-like [Leptopilina heterotoma]
MQATKGLQLVLLLGATLTCLAFLNKYPNISYKVDKSDFLPLANNVLHFKSTKLNKISLQRLESKIQQRLKNIEKFCENHNRTRQFETVISKLIIDVKNGISWCPIYKVASSLWMRRFAKLGGILTNETKERLEENALQISTIVNNFYNNDEMNINERLQKLKKTKIFLVVRHPFERLLSAYRDKLEHKEGRDYYYRRFGRHITYKYRKNKTENTQSEPLFIEFLEFIVKEKYFDEHWIPYTEACLPCDINYNYILKFETFEEESRFLLQQLKLDDKLHSLEKRNSTTKSILKNYYQQIPVKLLKKLYNIYEKDFQLFSYTPEEYYSLGKQD